jgi:hypothetical protein
MPTPTPARAQIEARTLIVSPGKVDHYAILPVSHRAELSHARDEDYGMDDERGNRPRPAVCEHKRRRLCVPVSRLGKGKGRTTAVDGVGTAVAPGTRVRRKGWCKAFSDEPKAEYPGLMTVTAMAMTRETRTVRARTLYLGVGAQVWGTGTEAGGVLMLRACEESERTMGRRPLIDKAPIEDLSLRSALPVSLLQPE